MWLDLQRFNSIIAVAVGQAKGRKAGQTSYVLCQSFRAAFTWLGACFVYVPLIWLGHFLAPIGLSRYVPLYLGYKGTTVGRIRQDVYDRFFTRIEQRFSRNQIATLTDTYADVVISDHGPYWHFLCRTQAPSRAPSIAAASRAGGSSVIEKLGTAGAAVPQKRRWRWLPATIGLLSCLIAALVFVTNVPTRLTAEDIVVFEKDNDFAAPELDCYTNV